MKKFDAGDVVQLKSGGPKMTVANGSEDTFGRIRCCWFKSGGDSAAADFTPEMLMKAPGEHPYRG